MELRRPPSPFSPTSDWNLSRENTMRHAKHEHTSKEDRFMERSRQESTCSECSCQGMIADETQRLWICMLEVQLRYGCYTSARMDMALNAGDYGLDLMPNRFIIDTLNESIVDLSDEGRDMLNRYLYPSSCLAKQKWKFWKKN
ncbi:uncharacterized protein B0J16DRAFT_359189 [Fusarium flagelliforme]|uniref:uncharacterized protein n=1 Tax=Fusarium flagelliforme TaxID=2675880 RepID=UPI001E8EDAF9|nr:uncharacterized protein B0J16DRAFT_359189 [Fusarium flagelliforme]KAH7169689.1 hypothetical protein B0J16DRAFT_359189 [Fusarium flagelliforme]